MILQKRGWVQTIGKEITWKQEQEGRVGASSRQNVSHSRVLVTTIVLFVDYFKNLHTKHSGCVSDDNTTKPPKTEQQNLRPHHFLPCVFVSGKINTLLFPIPSPQATKPPRF